MLKETCWTPLNLGIFGAAALLGLLILLIPAHKGERLLGLPKGTGKPADFADLATEDPAEQTVAEPDNVSSSPAPAADFVRPSAATPAGPKPVAALPIVKTNAEVPSRSTVTSAKTFPAIFPVLSLDRIYVRNCAVHLPVVLPRRPWSHLSDHAPLVAEIHL